ncbi:hypothetical protein FE257_005685 [Aspergillus nanangensis]|uniref:Major facilitator superfamily (MFS) profile domain-containing protein n=1 Tax=Aspergillus nanangensis TaxID=2582783 RepID=A0AAD4CPX2_ASPNN|nr:hypothetical protein FE257_005685 [Aspergillus nanangensis]
MSTTMTKPEYEKPGRVESDPLDHSASHISDQTREEKPDDENLPPVDGGIRAWLFLSACFVLEAVGWGFPTAFGVFQNHYRHDPAFEGSRSIAVIGTCSTGMAYLSFPFTISMMMAFPRIQCWVSTAGLLVMSLALALGSFSTTINHLILSQGVAYGIGCGLANTPSVYFVPDWFVKRKGLAYGIIWSGSAVTGTIFPVCFEALISRYGWQTSLRIASIVIFVASIGFIPYHKPRTRDTHTRLRQIDLGFLLNPLFLTHELGNILQGMGYFIPSIFLTSHAHSVGATGILSSLALTLYNITSVFGCVIQGYMVDHYHVSNCILGATVGAVGSIFLIWGLSNSIAPLYLFAILYGLSAGSFSSTWSAVTNEVRASDKKADIRMVFSFMEAGRGIGNMVSGPLSEALFHAGSSLQGHAWGAYGSEFSYLVIFTGLTALFGGVGFFGKYMR